MRFSRAPLIACLDGDDVWLPSKLERQVRLLDAEPGLGVCFTRRFLINPHGELITSLHSKTPRGPIFNEVLLNNFVCFSSVMIRRTALEHVGRVSTRVSNWRLITTCGCAWRSITLLTLSMNRS